MSESNAKIQLNRLLILMDKLVNQIAQLTYAPFLKNLGIKIINFEIFKIKSNLF